MKKEKTIREKLVELRVDFADMMDEDEITAKDSDGGHYKYWKDTSKVRTAHMCYALIGEIISIYDKYENS